jgi:hypothetical protein
MVMSIVYRIAVSQGWLRFNRIGFLMLVMIAAVSWLWGTNAVQAGLAQPAGPTLPPPPPGSAPVLHSNNKSPDAQPAAPVPPQVVLYDQYDNPATLDVTSQNFEASMDPYDDFAADDFVVPGGQSWSIDTVEVDGEYNTGPAASVNVIFYANNGGLPGAQVAASMNSSYTGSAGDFVITLAPAIVLGPGHYWMAVQANQDFTTNGQWFWRNRSVQSNSAAAWENPGGGFAVGCITWDVRTTCLTNTAGQPDQVFRLDGTLITSTPTPTPTPPPACANGLMIGSALALGYAPNNYAYLATNAVNYSFAHSHAALNEFAIFQTHDPWGATVVKSAITGAGHTYTVFTPTQLVGFTFSNYRVVVLNWDDHFVNDFDPPYSSVVPALESYVNAGGVLWVQGAIQGITGANYPMPFGGHGNWELNTSDWILDPGSPMVTGAPNPLTGNYASHATYSSLPGGAHVVVTKTDASGPPVLYDVCGTPPVYELYLPVALYNATTP